MNRPLPPRSAQSKRAWPPAPNVPSMTVSPGCTARSSRTSSARTGTWSALCRCEALCNKLCTPSHVVELLAPGLRRPELEVIADARDDDLLREPRVLDERARQHDAALLVELGLDCPGEQVAAHLAGLAAERV